MPVYADNLFLVFGFHGIALIDAESFTEAQARYAGHFNCDQTMIEHTMLAPDHQLWANYQPDPPQHECSYDSNADDCEVCDQPLESFYLMEIPASDSRLNGIDLEADKADVLARADQQSALWRDRAAEKERED